MDDSNDEIDLTSIRYKEKKPEVKEGKKENKKEPLVNEMQLDENMLAMQQRLLKPAKKQKAQVKVKEKPTNDDIQQKALLILHLKTYTTLFDELKSYKKLNFEKKTYEELQDLNKEFKAIMGAEQDLKPQLQAVFGAIQTYEYLLTEYGGVNCTGLTTTLAQDPQTIKTIQLLILKHSPLISVEPEAKLLSTILFTTIQMHQLNTTLKQQITPVNNDKIDKINKEYSDI